MSVKKLLQVVAGTAIWAALSTGTVFGHALPGVSVGKIPEAVDDVLLGLEINLFYRVDANPYFGANGAATHGVDQRNANWGEVVTKFSLGAAKDMDWAEISGLVTPFLATTAGQDVYGLAKDQEQVGLDQGWIQFGGLFGSSVDLKVGRQDVQIEKWFLMGSSWDMDTSGWLFSRYSFPFAATVNATTGSVTTTAFYARPGGLRQDGELDVMGANLHWEPAEGSYLYGGAYHQFDRDYATNNDITVWDLGGQATLLDSRLLLEGEFAYQTGNAGELDRKANAWFATATYNFSLAMDPYLRGMYVHYSGDADLGDDTVKDWDQFYDGFAGWNRWIQGEQTGELWLGNSNKNVAIVEVGFAPMETTSVSLHYLNHRIDAKESFGTSSSDWGDEINLFIDNVLSDQLFLHSGFGMVLPGDAAKEVAGEDDTGYFVQTWLQLKI